MAVVEEDELAVELELELDEELHGRRGCGG